MLSSDIFFRAYHILTNRNYLRSNENEESIHFFKDRFDEKAYSYFKCLYFMLSFVENKSLANGDEIATIFIRRSSYSHLGERKFRNLIDVMVYVGGLKSFFLAFLGIFFRYYNELSFLKTIANNCYTFIDEVHFS